MDKPKTHPKIRVSNRITDKVTLSIFIFTIPLYIAISVFGFISGRSIDRNYPTDSFGNQCGVGRFHKKPFLVYFDFGQCIKHSFGPFKCNVLQICVNQCPNKTLSFSAIQQAIITNEEFVINNLPCQYNISKTSLNLKQYILLASKKQCAVKIQASTPILNRCIPGIDFLSSLSNFQSKFQAIQRFTNVKLSKEPKLIWKNIIRISWLSLALIYITLLACLVCLMLTKYVARYTVWTCIVLSFITFFLFGLFIFQTLVSGDLHSIKGAILFKDYQILNLENVPILKSVLTSSSFLGSIGAFAILLSLTLLAIACVFRREIYRSTILIAETAFAISNVPSAIVWPFFQVNILLSVLIFYLLTCWYLRSSVIAVSASHNSSSKFIYVAHIVAHNRAALWIFIVLTIWYFLYFISIEKLTLTRLFLNEQNELKKEYQRIPFVELLVCFVSSIVFNSGSAAIGSVLIAITFVLSAMCTLIFALNQLISWTLPGCLKRITAPLITLSDLVRPISTTAYVLVVRDGHNFCKACREMFDYLGGHNSQYIILQLFSSFTIAIVGGFSIFLTGSFCLAVIHLIKQYITLQNDTSYVLEAFILSTIIGSIIVCALINIYRSALDVMFVCLLFDLKISDYKDIEDLSNINNRIYQMAKNSDLLPIEDIQNSGITEKHNLSKQATTTASDNNVTKHHKVGNETSDATDSGVPNNDQP
ncbi:hypothetical protein GJ496_007644 [Pomphorhynchus laevis]|nr:hypothetical protein GJ496_007644 [Pomphorhynchus laevis]